MSNKPFGAVLFPSCELAFLAHIVLSVCGYGVRVLVLVWHRLSKRCEITIGDQVGLSGTPLDNVLRLVAFAVASGVFF